jgi:hypothetical protein
MVPNAHARSEKIGELQLDPVALLEAPESCAAADLATSIAVSPTSARVGRRAEIRMIDRS